MGGERAARMETEMGRGADRCGDHAGDGDGNSDQGGDKDGAGVGMAMGLGIGLGLGTGIKMVILERAGEWDRQGDKSGEAKHSLAAGRDITGAH